MKNLLILGLSILTVQSAFSFDRTPVPGPGPGRDDSRQLSMCLRSLDDARRDADSCRRDSADPREVDGLRRENRDLRDSVDGLRRENQDLRRQLEQTRPNGREDVFSYAACKDAFGAADLKKLGAGTGMNAIEAETNALANAQKSNGCIYGVKIVKTDDILSRQVNSYCASACSDAFGGIDSSKQTGERGRSVTEATYASLVKTQKQFSCLYGVKVISCQ